MLEEQPSKGASTCKGTEVRGTDLRTGINLRCRLRYNIQEEKEWEAKKEEGGQFIKNFKPKAMNLDFPETNRQ